MNAYEIRVNGKNFLLRSDGDFVKHGFVTNIYVEANTEQEAENIAMNQLRSHEHLRSAACNEPDDPPMMYADEITEISNCDEIEPKLQGIIWYKETDE